MMEAISQTLSPPHMVVCIHVLITGLFNFISHVCCPKHHLGMYIVLVCLSWL